MASEDDLRGRLDLPFKEQIDFFAQKINLPTGRWDDIEQGGRDRAFVVAGAMKADLLADIKKSIAQHTNAGMGLEGYRRDFHEIIQKYGWKGFTGDDRKDPDNPKDKGGAGMAWRTRVTYMTNLRTSYAAGRYQQLRESPNLRYWMWKHNPLVAEARPQHLAWDGLTLPADHPFWNLHYPPQIPPHWGCRCRVVGVEVPEDAIALGGDPNKVLPDDWAAIDAAHKTQGADWNYAPGANALMPLREMVEKKLFKLDAPIGAAMWESLAPALAEERAAAFSGWLQGVLADPVKRGRVQVVGALSVDTLNWLVARKISPATAEIAVGDAVIVGRKAQRHAAAGNALTDAEWASLPTLLESPEMVLYDTRSGHLIHVAASADSRQAKLAIEFDYKQKKGKGEVNLIVSAFKTPAEDIQGAIAGGQYQVVR